MNKLLFVFNPTAGRMQLKDKLCSVLDYYTKQGYLVTTYPTQCSSDAYNFIKMYAREYQFVVCAGGDGTLNEVVSGLLDAFANDFVGYIPCGSTNDFAQTAGIPTTVEEAMEVSCNGVPMSIDIGCFNDRYFVYVAGFGLFTNVSYSTPQKMKNIFGYAAYILEGIKALSEIQSYSIILEHSQGVIQGEFIMGLVMNSFSVGGFKSPFFKLTKLDDELFEVVLIKMPKNILDLQNIVVDLINANINSKHIVYIQTSCLRVKSQSIEWTLDGEYGGCFEDVRIYNKNKAIKIMTKQETEM